VEKLQIRDICHFRVPLGECYNQLMQYAAFLRGVNVGGNGIIKMADLKTAVEKAGFSGVKTYIQSGNIILSSAETDVLQIAASLEKIILRTFKIVSPTVVITRARLENVLKQAPPEWEKEDLRRYIAFVLAPVTVPDVIGDFEIKPGVDTIKAGPDVIYVTTTMEGRTKSKLNRIMSKPSYKKLTMRDYNTVKKILALMEDRTGN
jgi:uncharacterized protein (DUF1697 family)